MGIFTKQPKVQPNKEDVFLLTHDELTSLFNYVLNQTVTTLVVESFLDGDSAYNWLSGHICVPVKASLTHAIFVEDKKELLGDKKDAFVPMIVNACGMDAMMELNIHSPAEEPETKEEKKPEGKEEEKVLNFNKKDKDKE